MKKVATFASLDAKAVQGDNLFFSYEHSIKKKVFYQIIFINNPFIM